MAARTKPQAPFAWLARYTTWLGLGGIVGVAAFFRFYQLSSLPPGLYTGEASLGLQALNLTQGGHLAGLDTTSGYAPLWTWLQALSVHVLGHTALALRIWPALVGTLAVLVTWLWVREWFGQRIAWLAAFLLAVTPWAVTLSRNALVPAFIPLIVGLTLWTAALAYRQRGTSRYLPLASVLALDLLSGPIGWLLAVTIMGAGIVMLARRHQLASIGRPEVLGLAGFGIGAAGLGYLLAVSRSSFKQFPHLSGLASGISAIGSNLVHVLLMFNVRGDENYRHNLAGEPLLNAFVGLMLVAGLLVVVSRLQHRRYRLLTLVLAAMLLPAVLTTTGVPNAARAAGALPLILTFAAIGIAYMLELWYITFPINSAARTTGLAAILVLLGLTLFQGYTQYFRAWGGSSQVHVAYNDSAVQMSHFLEANKYTGQRFVVADPEEQPVVAYLRYGSTGYRILTPNALNALPVDPGSRQFIISTSARDDAVRSLKLKFPGGVLRPHYSDFNLAEIYYTYEATK